MTKNNFLCFAVVLFLGLGLGVTANFAYANTCAPGCPQEACEAAQNHAKAKEVESKAHTGEIMPQNDNSPGMTCFDYAMALTSRLGGIFSDINPTGIIPVANSSVFGTSSFPDYGSATKLIKGLDAVVNPTIQAHASNFGDSLSAGIGATVLGYMNEFLNTTIQPIIDSITGPLATLNGYVGTMNGYVTAVQTAMNLVGLAMPGTITGFVAGLNAAWNTINSFISGAVAAITNIINGIVNSITSMINGALTSMMGVSAADGDCVRIAQLWGNGEPGGFRSLIGSAIERGTPYFSMIQMLSGQVPDSFGPPGIRLVQEIFNTSNATIITNALDDLLPGGVLSGPGSSAWWPATPTFGPGATTESIRSLMAAP
ncbi:MAG: hypothetical protein Q8K65_09180 [Alphaproteobacteria bacterium]|nr:hypothetical protein [Alphaproteobacteria bacterium]